MDLIAWILAIIIGINCAVSTVTLMLMVWGIMGIRDEQKEA